MKNEAILELIPIKYTIYKYNTSGLFNSTKQYTVQILSFFAQFSINSTYSYNLNFVYGTILCCTVVYFLIKTFDYVLRVKAVANQHLQVQYTLMCSYNI